MLCYAAFLTAVLSRGSSPGFSGLFLKVGWVAGVAQVKRCVGFVGCRKGAWKFEIRTIGGGD